MNTNLGFLLALHRAHASLQFKLDNELGLYHGISFNDFALLDFLAQSDGGRASFLDLVRPMGQAQSAVLRQLIVLEKMGLVTRAGTNGVRQAVLCPAGRALVNAARETVDSVGTEAIHFIDSAVLEMVVEAMTTLGGSPALARL